MNRGGPHAAVLGYLYITVRMVLFRGAARVLELLKADYSTDTRRRR